MITRSSEKEGNALPGFDNAPVAKNIGRSITRRAVLKGSASAGAFAAVGGSLLGTWPIQAHAAVVNVELRVEVLTVGPLQTRAYNGLVPGPTISAAPGDRIDVHLVNNLPVNEDDNDCPVGHGGNHGTHISASVPASHNEEHGLNTTNLHTHGLHVSPYKDSTGQFDADNVFLQVLPKDQVASCWDDENFRRQEASYRFELSQKHPPGTNWYHAHKHGSTNVQVLGGMAGPLIVRDPPGWMPSYIEKAPERTFMFMSTGAVLVDPNGGGVPKPTIALRPGAVERWRIINANVRGTAFVRLGINSKEVELWQIAYDGLTLPRRLLIDPSNTAEPWENPASLAPGNRMDLMVRVKKSAPAVSVALRATQGSIEFLNTDSDDGFALAAAPVQIGIKIQGDPMDAEWSEDDTLPGPGLDPIEPAPTEPRTVQFKEIEVDGVTVNAIGDELYDGKVKQSMKLGSTEQWTIENLTDNTHPFHIHVNPFFVTHINGVELPANSPLRRWQDTVALPPANDDGTPGSVTFRTRFDDFTGTFVIHCHILLHEDHGMMQKVEIV